MSTLPASAVLSRGAATLLTPPQAAAIASLLAIFGVLAIWPTAVALQALWLSDDLKSIGMIVPLVSLVLILRAWRAIGWQMHGSWVGLVSLFGTILAVQLRQRMILVFIAAPQWSIYIPPHALIAFAYGASLALLFGGPRLLRAALFPICLLWLVNPVPHVFNVLVDLPLQHASAHVARAFAMAMGQPLTPDQLRLMFTPDFGMFIAPGCNGIRGAVTMGLIALVAGYLYRFRPLAHAALTAAAILLGYAFNFLRLCLLVVYYILALHLPRLQNHGEMADYYIGGALFLLGAMLLIHAMRRLGQSSSLRLPPVPATPPTPTPVSFYPRAAALLALLLCGAAPVARARLFPQPPSPLLFAATSTARFPPRVGHFTLTRTWTDTLTSGIIVYQWGDYTPDQGGTHVAIGVSPVLGSHDTLICHSARGEDPLWHNQITLPTAAALSVPFSAAFYNDGAIQYLEATTLCNGASCGEFSTTLPHFGFVYSRPDPRALFQQDTQRSIPIVLRAETTDITLPAPAARQQLTATLSSFLAATGLDAFTLPFRQ